jgi:hypothetical protein
VSASEPVPFEIHEAGVYLHGTKADLAVGEMLVPGRESNFAAGRVMNDVYFTASLDAATGVPSSLWDRAVGASTSSSRWASSRMTPT